MAAIRREGREVERGHPFDPQKGHGFIDSQKMGCRCSASCRLARRWWWSRRSGSTASTFWPPALAPRADPHRRNWSGEWPGLVAC